MSESLDKSRWVKVEILTPGMMATPEQVNAVLRSLFSEDSVLDYQRRVAEGGAREAVGELRQAMGKEFATRAERDEPAPKDVAMLTESLLNMLDPDHEKWNGFYPSKMLCPNHEQPSKPGWSPVLPVFSECPGMPRCKAYEGVREW